VSVEGAPRIVDFHFGRHVHPLYREQVHAVPPGWAYRTTHPAMGDATVPTKRVLQQRWLGTATRLAESLAVRALSEVGYVHRVRARHRPDASLIHSCERLIRDAPGPYVVDLEQGSVFVLYQRAALGKLWTRHILERAFLDERLRFILPWSDAARRSVLHGLSDRAAEQVDAKVRVVSPAIRPLADRPHERRAGPLRVLFVGTAFYEKGAVAAVAALREARSNHEIRLDLVSYVPEEWARRWADEPGLTLHAPGGADLIQRLYAQSDVLLFPSHMDTFGYVVLEALAHGLPVIAPDWLAYRESIHHDVSGLLFPAENMLWDGDMRCNFRHTIPVPTRYVRRLRFPSEAHVRGIAVSLQRLAEDRDLHARLAAGALDSVMRGHLSIGYRKRLLGDIYAAAAA
jgi:glycosyltransferase involved in cell wall biosynthesis